MRQSPPRPDDGRRGTEGEVLAALVDGLIAEDLFGFRSRGRIGSVAGALYLPLTGDERHVQISLGSDGLVFRARPVAALAPYRLSRPPVLLLGADGPVPLSPREVLDLVVARLAETRPPNLDEVLDGLDLAVTHGATLLAAEATWSRVITAARPTLLDWEALTAVGDRPFHPTGRARVGWDQARHRRYSPGAAEPIALDWVAVRRDHLHAGVSDFGSRDDPGPADVLLGPADRARLASAEAAAGVGRADHVVVPVHPWQLAHVLPMVFAGELAAGVVRPVATGIGSFRATAATRTLAPVPAGLAAALAPPGAVHVKLPVGISTLGALRLLPPRYLANAARAQTLLEAAAVKHPALAGRLHACDERAWWAFSDPGLEPDYRDKPGHLGCLLRVWPDGVGTGPGEHLVPLGALGVVLPDGSAPGLARLIADRHDDPASPGAALAVFDDVARVVSEVALACFGLGFLPELHGQNAVLATSGGRVDGIVLRDHDTVRVHRPWLAEAGLPDPGYHVKPGTSNSLAAATPEELLGWFQTLAVEVSLRAVGRVLTTVYGVAEETVWRRLAQVVRAARAGVDLPPTAAEVSDRQLFHAARWPTKLVLGPLLDRVGTGGGSMPSAVGRAGNPFLAGDDRAAELAAHATAERLVNCYLRESEVEPVVVGSTMTIPFPRLGRAVVGSLAYRSPGGHHRFRPGFSLRTGSTLAPADLAPLVAAELDPGPDAAGSDGRCEAGRCDALAALVEDSEARTRLFLQALPVTGTVVPWQTPNPFLAAEQAVRLGHPLHPAAKASAGFSAPDVEAFAPELGASFPLHWLAADPDRVEEDRLATVRSLDPPPALHDAAAARLGPGRATWPLLPVHPWQARHLAGRPELAELVAAGR
ncbi:MAG TPA: IucA/IucC family protein, partial [Acidimicrobiia bacterium]|nr:IucA/IucC family protein [Acidimicrobiia bacterium]